MASNNKKGCIYAVVGCSVFAVAGVIIAAYLIFQQAQLMKANFANPEPRAIEMLGTESMPEGYYANFAFSLPFIMDMVIISNQEGSLTDKENTSGEPFGTMGFFYFKFLNLGKDSNELQDYFEGKTDNAKVLREKGVNIDVKEILNRGAFSLDGNQVFYLTQRGSISSNGARADGLSTLMLIQCPNDKKMRMGIWFGPETASQPEASEVSPEENLSASLEGTVGDLEGVQAFMSQFSFCK